MDKTEFSNWLVNERALRGMSQRELGRRSGVVHSTIALMETGKQLPTADHIISFGVAFRMDIVALLRKFQMIPPSASESKSLSSLESKLSHLTEEQRRDVENYVDFVNTKKERIVDKPKVIINREAAPLTEAAL